MKIVPRLVLPLSFIPAIALAVYAPIPEPEQGKALSFRVGASVYHDSNIFGAATGEVDSMVFNVSPALVFNNSVTDQTFVSAGYELSLDHLPDRPAKQNLTSHTLNARIAHQFSEASTVDVSDYYQIAKNPQSLLAGIPLNSDQSFKRNEFNARYTTSVNEKTGVTLKYRNTDMAYDTANLAAQLDNMQQIVGLEGSFALLPETKLVGEYRFLDVSYDTGGSVKDKTSHFFLVGADYSAGKNLLVTGRAGMEDRNREGERDTGAPYFEVSTRYTYDESSFLAAGYTYTLDESSDVIRFTDTQVNRFFVNAQHKLSALVTLSGSFTFEPSELVGRRGVASIDEDTTRLGLGLTWAARPNVSVTATYDFDRIESDDANRDQVRNRVGVSARVTF